MAFATIKAYGAARHTGLILMHVSMSQSSFLPPSLPPYFVHSYRASVVSPGRPLHLANLDVEWKVLDGDHAAGSEYAMREPRHCAVGRYDCVRVDDGVVVVGIRAARLEA